MEQLKLKEYELGKQLMTAEAKVVEKSERSN